MVGPTANTAHATHASKVCATNPAPRDAPDARPTDGFNLWPAITTAGTPSPRVEIIHAVQNAYFNKSRGDYGISAARFGKFKVWQKAMLLGRGVVSEPSPPPVPLLLSRDEVDETLHAARMMTIDE